MYKLLYKKDCELPRPVISFCLRPQAEPRPRSPLWKAGALSAKPPILLENLLHVHAKGKQNPDCSGLWAKSEHNTHTPQQAGKVLHQGLAITNRHRWLQTRLCHKSLYADSLGYARLFVSCRYFPSSWKGRQSWSILALSEEEVFANRLLKCRAASCSFFYSLPLCTVSTFVLQEQVQRAARYSKQDFLLSCSLLWNLWSLQSLVKSVSYIPMMGASSSWTWCSAVLQEHTPCENPSHCRSVTTYTRTI